MPVIVPEKNAIFIHLPKNAGTSVTRWMQNNISFQVKKAKRKHDGYQESLSKYGPFNFSFVVVRNPYDRIVSSYFYNKRLFDSREDITLQDVEKLNGRKKDKRYRTYKLQEIVRKGFAEFVKSKYWHPVQKPQHEMSQGVQHILKYENLQEDFKIVQNYFECDKPLSSSNVSQHRKYQDYYTEELYDIVTKEFKKDLEVFNYCF